MAKLKHSRGWRGGATQKTKTQTSPVTIHENSNILGVDDSVEFRLSMDSKGGGTIEVYVTVGSGDFGAVIEAMIAVDRDAALAVLSACLAKQLERPA